MANRRFNYFSTGLFLSVMSLVLSSAGNCEESNRLHLNEALAGVVVATQGGGSSIGPIVKYLPRFDLKDGNSPFSLGLDLGVTAFNNSGHNNFFVLQYAPSLIYRLNSNWDTRLALGLQTWTSGNGTAFYFSPSLTYHFDEKILKVIDGISASYSGVTQKTFASLFSLGINFVF